MPRSLGQITTSSTSKVTLASTAYTEPVIGAQRALVSSSASDSAAGTGARTVRITYYTLSSTGAITGPFVEVVTLNGTSPVPTVGTTICLIEKLEVVTAGSGGVSAGGITLTLAADGTGGTITSIPVGTVRNFLGVHYVPSNRQCSITDVEVIGGDTTIANVEVLFTPYPLVVEQSIKGQIGSTAALPRAIPFPESAATVHPGPCRLRMAVTPGSNTSQVTTASYGFVDRMSVAF